MNKFLKNIFEVTNISSKHKQLKIFGIKLKLKRKDYEYNQLEKSLKSIKDYQQRFLRDINRVNQTNLSTAQLHEKTFAKFKNIHAGEEIVVVASGPSAKYYQPIPNAIHIAVNRSFILDNIDFKYLFIQDFSGPTTTYIDDLCKYKKDTCQKFFGLTVEYNDMHKVIPESYAIKANALRYRTDWAKIHNFQPKFAYDLMTQPLGCFGSIVFPALQFALWTNPKTIYLVGCDCTNDGYFNTNTKSPEFKPNQITEAYKKFKHFASVYYPDTKIISINPRGLKGLFEDIYTKNYEEEFIITRV